MKKILLKNKKGNVLKSGFTLLELMIVIVVIGLLLSVALGMVSSKETAKVSVAEQLINKIRTAADVWSVQNATEDFTNISLDQLKQSKALPSNFDPKKANPWAGNIEVSVQGSTGNQINHYTIKLKNVPAEACTTLANKFVNKAYTTPQCVDEGGAKSFEVTF